MFILSVAFFAAFEWVGTIAHSEYVWHVHCVSIDVECLLLPEATTLTPIPAHRRKLIYLVYALFVLSMIPAAWAAVIAI